MSSWTRRRLLRTLPAALAPALLPRGMRAAPASAAPFSRFVDVGSAAGLTHPTFYGEDDKSAYILEVMGAGCAFIDYDSDGWMDIFLLTGRHLDAVPAGASNRLYKNNRDGTFTDVTEKAGLSDAGWAMGVCVGDYNNDGFDDLFVTYYGQNRLYHNNGNGTFTEEAQKLGLGIPGKELGISVADYDRDGHPDLFVANDSMVEFLFHNKGNGTFEEVGLPSGVAVDGDGRTFAGMGTDFADYNNDGWPDLFVDDLANQKYALYRNDGDGTFSYDSSVTGMGGATLLHSGWGVRWMDYDNDGWKDLLIAQAHDLDTIEKTFPDLHYREPPMLLRNLEGKKFVDVGPVSKAVFQQQWVGRGLAIGDIDNDGRLDAVITENGGPAHILMNRTETANHWIGFRLVGHKSNRDGIGAVIRIDTSQGSQWETVTTSSSYLSASDVRAHFGLGRDTSVKAVVIRWPSGIVQTLKNVAGGQYVRVDEPVSISTGHHP